MLTPALAQARDRARSIKCVSNLHQLGVGFALYGDEKGVYVQGLDMVPPVPVPWFVSLSKYVGKTATMNPDGVSATDLSPVFQCPSAAYRPTNGAAGCSYTSNRRAMCKDNFLVPAEYPLKERLSELVLILDCGVVPGSDNGTGWSLHSFTSSWDAYGVFSPATANNPVSLGPDIDAIAGGGWAYVRWRHHSNTGANFLFADGHVEFIAKGNLLERHMKWNP
jgi:prepilin-type processing-associated H-X9-DG protein